MNKFLKAIISLAFLSVSALAAAQQCIPAPQIMGQQQRCYDGRLIGPGGVVYGQQQVVHGQQQVVQQAIYGSVPAGIPVGSSSQCAGIAERLGRVVGANHSNNSRGTENGGLLGYLVGNIFCSSIVGNQQVIANQQPQGFAPQQGAAVTRGQSQTTMFECDYGNGKPIIYVKNANDCAVYAERTVVPASITKTSEPAERPAANDADDLWKWRAQGASPSNPVKCVVERLTGEPKPSFCSEMKALPRQEGETRANWRIRAENA